MNSFLLLLCTLLASRQSLAYNPLTNNNTALKFNFLPLNSETVWGALIRGENATCANEYQHYLSTWKAQEWHEATDWAWGTTECILEKASELQKKTGDSAAILLGLAPILFSSLGPSLTEIGLVSLQRPFLALLLSLGSAAIFPSRVFSYVDDDARDKLKQRTTLQESVVGWLGYRSREMSGSPSRRMLPLLFYAVGVAEYLIIAAAAFNIIYTSWQLGVATVYVPDCPTSCFPVIWTLLPLGIHVFTSGAMLTNKVLRLRSSRQDRQAQETDTSYQMVSASEIQDGETGVHNAHGSTGIVHKTIRDNHTDDADDSARAGSWCRNQLLPSFAHPPMPAAYLEPTNAMILIHNFTTALAFAHVFFGVIVYSSLLFVGLVDAAVILLRYLISISACRLVLAFELGGIRLQGQ